MMILEVNNTFGERRIYLLKGTEQNSHSETGLAKSRFTDSWPKDFHVSPFNSRKGGYSVSVVSPYESGKFKAPGVDNAITLRSSKDSAKLVATLRSVGPPIEVHDMTTWDAISFFAQWSWLGFFTFPRILKEAFLLFFYRGLHVWLRPEIVPTSIARREKLIER
jgi:DUF1365 family protein